MYEAGHRFAARGLESARHCLDLAPLERERAELVSRRTRQDACVTTSIVRTIPWDWYRDPAVLAREQEAIFRSAWHYVGIRGEPGDVVPGWAGHVPVVLVRAGDGEERAFVNVCRHRGSVVVEEPGKRKTLQCPYHAWTYDLDGSLRAAPRSEREGLDLSEVSLAPVRLEGWGPFRFVNLDDDAAPLA